MKNRFKKLLSFAAAAGITVTMLPQSLAADGTPEVESSLARYVVDNDSKTVTMPDTTVEKLKSVVTGADGATVAVKNASGAAVTSGAVIDTYKLVASKNGSDSEYSIVISEPTVALNTSSKLGAVSDGTTVFSITGMDSTTLFDYSGKGLLGINHTSAGYTQMEKANPKVTAEGSYAVIKTNMPGHTESDRVNAWHFTETDNTTGGWRKHSSNALGMHSATAAAKGDKTVIAFKARLAAGGGISIAPRHAYGSKPDCTDIQYLNTTNTGHGDRVTFTGGKIKLGGQNRDWSLSGASGNYYEDISTYTADSEYDVVLVESRGTTVESGITYKTVVTEALYINGSNVLSSPRQMVIKDGRDYFAIRDITLQTVGDVYIGGLKIYMTDNYDPTVISSPPQITSSLARYTIDDANKIITMPYTSVEKLKSTVTGVNGTAVTVKDKNGTEVSSGTVKDTYKLVASKRGHAYEYSIELSEPEKVFDVSDALEGIPDDQLLFEAYRSTSKAFAVSSVYTPSNPTAASGSLVGFTAGSTGFGSALKNENTGNTYKYRVSKSVIPNTAIPAYKYTYTQYDGKTTKYAYHKAGDMTARTTAANGDKLIINFKLYLGADGLFSIYPYHAGYATAGDASSGVKGYDLQATEGVNTGVGDRVTLNAADGSVNLGGLIRSSAGYSIDYTKSSVTYGTKIGDCAAETLYDVTIVKSRGTWNDNGTTRSTVITEGVYLNGTNLLSTPSVLNISEDREYFAIREIAFFTAGTSYMSGLNIYMADNYSPDTFADLTITPKNDAVEIYANDPLENNLSTIKGYSGTVADLKNSLSADDGVMLEVLDSTGNNVLSGSTPLQAGMILRVSDTDHKERREQYLLSDKLNLGEYSVSEQNGTVTISRTVKAYKAENKVLSMIAARFDVRGKMLNADYDKKTIASAGTYSFELTMPGNAKINMMLWDSFDNMISYKPLESYVSAIGLTDSINGYKAASYGAVDVSVFE